MSKRRCWKHILWKCINAGKAVSRLDVKGHRGPCRLPWNGAAIDAIAADAVTSAAIIGHRNRRERRGWIDTIFQRQGNWAIRVGHPRRHHDRLICSRQNRSVNHVINGGADIGHRAAIASAGGAQIWLDLQTASHFQ